MLAARSFAELVIARKTETSPGDPTVTRRAAIVAGIGPLVITTGFVWTLLQLLLLPFDLYWRSIIFNPAHQLMVAGVLISIVCLPVARDMLTAGYRDIEAPDFTTMAPPSIERPKRYRRPRIRREVAPEEESE